MTVHLWDSFLTDRSSDRLSGCVVLQEGVSIMTGLTYNGKDENGNALWDSCANIRIRRYEKASTCEELILSFNINTNRWMGK